MNILVRTAQKADYNKAVVFVLVHKYRGIFLGCPELCYSGRVVMRIVLKKFLL